MLELKKIEDDIAAGRMERPDQPLQTSQPIPGTFYQIKRKMKRNSAPQIMRFLSLYVDLSSRFKSKCHVYDSMLLSIPK